MSDTSRDRASLLWTAKPRPARLARPGELAWRLRHADGRVHRCELRNDADAGGGWDVQFYQGDDLLFSRPCADEALARYAAAAMKQDQLRTSGWAEDAASETGA
jgi:hypothetical protein